MHNIQPAERRPRGACIAAVLAATVLASIPEAVAQKTTGLNPRPGRKPINLFPFEEKDKKSPGRIGTPIDLGGWTYRATRAASPRDGVPWELIVTPSASNPGAWRPGAALQTLPVVQVSHAAGPAQQEEAVPVIEIPEIIWKKRMDSDLQDVVGIHFHEFLSDDVASILYTLHKVPPDNPDGSPPAPGSYSGRPGTRIEATLLSPVVWSLDQSIVVRVDDQREPVAAKRQALTDSRTRHEAGHAEVSHQVLLKGLKGPQDWSPDYCIGRRSRIVYYWKREMIGRSWKGYQGEIGKLKTMRTSIALVPPTRWSKLIPLPPERITQKHINQFNDEIVKLGPRLARMDKIAQDRYHAHHGTHEQAGHGH